MTIQEIPLAPPPATETKQLRPAPASPVQAPPQSRRTWPWVAAAVFAAVMVGLAGVIVWLMASTVPTGDYDDAVAEFEAAQTTVTALAEENSGLAADLASLSDEQDQLVASIAVTAIAAKARAHIDLNFDPMFVEEMAQAGTEFAPFDELLATLGEDMTFTQWVASGRAFGAPERYVYETDDAQLIDAWNEWLGAEIGSVEGGSAYDGILLCLDKLINELPPLTESGADPALTGSDAG